LHSARAAELYKKCIALDPSYAPPYVSLALILQTKEKAREVEELVNKGLAVPAPQVNAPGFENPRRSRSDLITALAISKGFQGRNKDAEELLLQAIELYPVNSQAYDLLSGYYHTSDRAKEIELLKKQVTVFPNSSQYLRVLANRLIEDKRFDDAVPFLEKILARIPNDFFANYQLGQIYRTKNECDRAGRYLTAAKQVASGPDDTKALEDAFDKLQQQCAGS
jgi:tetratricopeptide (TPR) repeat protein